MSVCLSSFILRTTFRLQVERTSKKEDPGNEVGRETGFVISFFKIFCQRVKTKHQDSFYYKPSLTALRCDQEKLAFLAVTCT